MPPRTDPPTSRRAFAILLVAGGFLGGAVCVGLFAALATGRAAEVARAQHGAALAELEHAEKRELESVESGGTQAPALQAPSPEAGESERSTAEGWWSTALQAWALEGIARGWREVRTDALPSDQAEVGLSRFRDEVEPLPLRIGRELAEQRGFDEIVATGIETTGVFRYLELLDADAIGPFPDLVEDASRFGALFDCSVGGPTLDGKTFAANPGSNEPLEAGTTIRFGAGVTRVHNWRLHPGVPPCLTIEGAGMNATLLLANAIHDYQRIENLQIRDCTLLATGVEALDLRGRGSVVLLERVRIIGFDAGAGSSNALSLNHTALVARDCRFETGYGRSSDNSGCLFDVRTSALLARFERCRFEAMELELERMYGRATVVFADCNMIDLRDRSDPRTLEHPGIRFVNCSVQMAVPDAKNEKRVWKRDLNELFPGWESMR